MKAEKTNKTDKKADTAKEAEKMPASIEEAFDELQTLLDTMNGEDISLEQSFACYERGMKLIRYCNETIDRVEKKVQVLSGQGDTQPFTGNE